MKKKRNRREKRKEKERSKRKKEESIRHHFRAFTLKLSNAKNAIF